MSEQTSSEYTSSKRNHFRLNLLEDTNSQIPSGNITFVIAFAIPVIMFIALYYVRSIYPFGESCYLRSDMYHQYAPFFSELWNKLRNGESLTYSWNIGMGTDFTSLFAYYLASPANWIIVLFPQKYIIEVMNALIILKLAGSSTTLTYYLSKHFHTKKCSLALFGIFYGMSAYAAAYSWNIMWLDCILLLPLIMLGLEQLVKENKCLLYCISLGLCIYTNYYISIMVCMSVILYFVVLMIAYNGKCHPTIYLKKFLHWCLYSLIAGGLSACLLLPELYTFSLSASSNIAFPSTLSSYFSVLQMLTRQLINVPVHLGLEHYPNIYCGVAVFLLIPLYIMNSKVNTREKIGKVVLLLIFLTAFNLNIPNFIWHGFHYPNSLPCRQAFVYIFFLITMSYEGFHKLEYSTRQQFAGAIWFAVAFLLITEQLFTNDGTYDFKVVYISGAFILFYALLLYLKLHTNWKMPVLLFFAFAAVTVEATINMESTGIGTTSRTAYLLDYDAVKHVTNAVAKEDDSFYRMDKVTGSRSKNDGAWHNYKTISTFSSTSNAGMSDLFGYLGFEHSMNAYGYNGATLVTDSLFSVRYTISNKHLAESTLKSYVTGSDGEFIYKNSNTLPVGYMIPSDAENTWKPSTGYNGIENQNSLIKSLTGISDVFTQVYEFRNETDNTFQPEKNGHMYLVVTSTGVESVGVSINGTISNFTGLKNGNHILDIGFVTTTDTIEAYSDTNMSLMVYTLNNDRFAEAYNILNAHGIQLTSHSTTKLSGTVNAATDGNMLFSIPFDGGWSVYVDGKKVTSAAFKDALLTVPVSAGEHTITLRYLPVNLIKGCIITIICIMILIAISIFKHCCRSGKINISNWPLFLLELTSEEDIIFERPEIVVMTQAEINENINNETERELHDANHVLTDLDELDDFDNIELDEEDNTKE